MRLRVPATAPSVSTAIWVTDDILADAFHRFARVSHTHTTRRHGCNIPGPLEARRRHARPRMGQAPVAAAGGPPMVDVGALFGLGARPSAQPEKSWKWEAPSLHAPGLGAGAPPPPPMAATWLPVSSDRHELQQRRGQLEAVEDLMRAVKASQTAFRDLLSSHQHLEKLDVSVMQEIVAFLQSSKDEPQAQNGLTLTTWLAQRDIEQEALHAMALCIRDKARLRTLDEDQLRHVLASLLGRIDGEAPSIEQAFAEALDALPASQRHGAVTELSRHFRTSFKLGKHNTDTIRTLFRILDSFQSLQGSHVQHSTWHQVYRRLGSLLRPAALAEHLCSLDRTDLAQVLLRYWVPRYLEQLNDGTAAELHDHGKFRRITIASRMRSRAEVHGIVHEYAQLWTSTPIAVGHGLDDGSKKHTDPLIDLLVMLAKWRKSYAIFLQDLLDMLSAVQTRGQVWTTFESVRRHPELGVPNSVAKTLVHYLAATSDPAHLHLAWEVFEAVPSLSVLECIDFTLQLIEHGLGTPDRIFHLLNKKTGPDIVKPEFRGKPQLALQSAHIDLAHLAAYAWAKQENTPSRVAFRRVWEVYRFLQDRGAPLSALMSRSLVRAGVVRPIQEGKNVSLAQMKYILALVQRLEGDDVAADLDRLVWPINKRLREPDNQAASARRTWWAGRVEDGIARAVRWRLRLWTRRRGAWYDADGPVAKRRGGEVVERASPSDTERLAAMQSVADGGLEHAVWRQEIDELVKGDSSGELAERELDDARDGFADVAHASPLWAFTTPTASEVPAAFDEPAKSLPEEPLTFYDPESSWSEVDGPSTTDARVLPPLEEPTQLLPEEPLSFYDPWSILSEAESSSAADPRVPASIEEPAHLLLDEPLISYDAASSLSGVDGASAAESVAITNDQKMEHPTAADVLPSIPIRKILLPAKPADKATVRAMKEETQAEVDGVSTAENVPILNDPKVERIAVADVLPSILIKKILHPAKPPKNAAARDEMETPRIEADGASTADNATITKEVEDAAVTDVLLSFGSVPIKMILYPAKPADKKAAVRAKKERSQTEANVALTADHVTITKNVDHTAVGNVPLSLGSVPITKIFHPAKPAQKAAARDRMEKIGTEAAQGPVEREDGEFNASMSVPITKTLGPTKLPSEADVRAEKEKPQTEGPKGWVESAEGEVNAAAWRDFSQQWRARRKRSGYDTYAKRASGIL